MSEENQTASPPSILDGVYRVFAALLRLVAYPIVAGLTLQVLAILISRIHPALELANHFAAHGLMISCLTLTAILLQTRRSRLLLGALLGTTGYLLFLVQPWGLYLVPHPSVSTELGNSIHVLSWNVLAVNQDYADIDKVIREVNADVVVLIETQPHLLEHLPFLSANYPHSHKILHWGGNGICVFSRIPGTEFVTEPFRCEIQPAIVATVPAVSANALKADRASVKLVGMHTLSPIPLRRTSLRNEQLAAVSQWSTEHTLPVCLCGDLNTTPWTASFAGLTRVGFIDSRIGVGNLATWPTPLRGFGIPIDHALTRGNCQISERKVVAAVPGSDHHLISFRLHY